MKGDLTEGPPLARLSAFGLPLVFGSIAHALFNLVDVWLVGRYAPIGADGAGREAALAAIHNASVLNFIPMLVANGISTATIATVSRLFGAGERRRAHEVIHRSLVLSFLVGAAMSVIAGATARQQLDAIRISKEAFPAAYDCLGVMSYGSITMFVLLQLTAVERAVGRSTAPVVLLIGANVLNAIASVILIPRFGAVGTAWATVLSRGAFAAAGVIWLYSSAPELRAVSGALGGMAAEAVELFRLGVPASLQLFARAIAVIVVTGTLSEGAKDGEHATEIAASYGIALRLEMIAMFACAGWGSAAAAAVGQCLGAGKPERAIRMAWLGGVSAAGGMLLIGALFYFAAPKIFPFFVEDARSDRIESIVMYGTHYFRTVAFAYAFVGLGIVLAESVNGAGATRLSFVIDFGVYVVGLWVLAKVMVERNGVDGLWLTLFLAHTAAAVVYVLCFRPVLRALSSRRP